MQHVRFGVRLGSRAVHLPRLLHPPNGHCQTISAGGNCTAPPGASGQALRAQGICGSVEAMSAPRRSSYCLRMLVAVLAAFAFDAAVSPPSVSGENAVIASRQRTERKTFTDGEIIDGFFKTAFGAEYHLAGRVDRIRKYDMPVRVFAGGSALPDRQALLAAVVADIGARVAHLDIAMADSREAANVIVNLV